MKIQIVDKDGKPLRVPIKADVVDFNQCSNHIGFKQIGKVQGFIELAPGDVVTITVE